MFWKNSVIVKLIAVSALILNPLEKGICQDDVKQLARLIVTDNRSAVKEYFENREAKERIFDPKLLLFAQSVEMFELLVNLGADPAGIDTDGMNMLMVASQEGNNELVEHLLRRGVSVNAKDHHGRAALYFSGGNADSTTLDLLLANGAFVDLQTSKGVTTLMFAASEGNIDAVRSLLESGANMQLQDMDGKTVWEYAKLERSYVSETRREAISQILKEEKRKREVAAKNWVKDERKN